MAFCTECGNPLQDGAKFCFQCGTPVSAAAPAAPPENNGVSENPVQTDENFGYVQQSPSDGYIQNQTIGEPSQQSSATEQENIKTVWTKPTDGDQQLAMSPLVDAETTPEILPDTYEEDDDDYDFSQHDFDKDNPTREDQPDLSKLSTATNMSTPPTAVDTLEDISVERDPATDPFYDSVMPEIENEIYKLPKDIFVKGILLIVAIVVIIFWLLFVLS